MELAQELEARGHRNALLAVSLGHEGDRVPELEALVAASAQRPQVLVGAARALRRRLRAEPADVIVAHGAAAALVAVGAAPRRGPAIVWQTIVAMAPQSFRGAQGAAWRVAARRLDGVVALTAALGDEARRLGFRGPVWPIPNARRTERFDHLDRSAEGQRLRAELGVAGSTLLVGIVGYLVAQKQPQRAVEVLAGLRAADADVHLVVGGSGPLAGVVEQRALELGVADRLSLIGHRDDVPQVLAGLDVLVLTSDDEGIPGIVIEAALAGCPVVTFPFDGAAEVIDAGVTGEILDAPSAAAMAAVVGVLLADPDRRRAMGTAARQGAARFSMATVAGTYEAHLAEVVASPDGGSPA